MTRHVGIDPASATGIVAIGEDGKLIGWKELKAKGDSSPARINDNMNNIYRMLREDDNVCIEGFAMEAKYDTNKVSSGHNWGARLATDRKVGRFEVATPNQLKSFVNVEEWEGPKGKRVRLDTDEVKRRVQVAVATHWGDHPTTFNIADAYVLARIAEAIWLVNKGKSIDDYPDYQQEILKSIMFPEIAKKKKKADKAVKKKREQAKAKPAAYEGQTSLF
jgi:crossover junction endodeoxyribonuclease RuvC